MDFPFNVQLVDNQNQLIKAETVAYYWDLERLLKYARPGDCLLLGDRHPRIAEVDAELAEKKRLDDEAAAARQSDEAS